MVLEILETRLSTPGVSIGELRLLQACLVGRSFPTTTTSCCFKPTKEIDAYTDPAEIVVTAGLHFVVVAKNTDGKIGVVLDYPSRSSSKRRRS
jgi:hypothetical protein